MSSQIYELSKVVTMLEKRIGELEERVNCLQIENEVLRAEVKLNK